MEEKVSLCKCLVKILHEFGMGQDENVVRKLSKWTVEADLMEQMEVRVIISKPYESC